MLSSKLPYGFTRERAPGKEVVYFNEITGEVSNQHPHSNFLRKTFTKVVKGELDYKKSKHKSKIVVDYKTKQKIKAR